MLDFLNTLFRYREKKSPDFLGRYPQEVHIAALPERRYLWTSRVLVIFSAFSLSLTMMLASAVYMLLPLRGSTPRLLTVNPSLCALENALPAETAATAEDLLTEQLLRKYIKLRHEIPESQAELMTRWAPDSEFYWLSSLKVFQEFSDKATNEVVSRFLKQGFIRKVKIEWVKQLTPGLWLTQFHTINTAAHMPKPNVIIWRVYARIKYEDVDLEERKGLLQNPYGFKITNYSLTYAGRPEKSESYLETAKQIREQNYRN